MAKLRNSTSIAIFLVALLSALTLPAPAMAKTEWRFDVLHVGSGAYRYYVTDDAIRLENTANGGITVAAAPTWRVSSFRPSDKLEYITDLKNFDASLILSIIPKNAPTASAKPKLIEVEQLRGLPCNKYLLASGSIYWSPKDLKVAPQVSEVVARYFSTSSVMPLPVRILQAKLKISQAQAKKIEERKKKSAVPWLNFSNMAKTENERLGVDLTAWKKVPYKPSDFEYPKGYKRANDLKDVIISAAYRNDIMDLAKDLTKDIDVSKQKIPGSN